jgi:hypothetical protein
MAGVEASRYELRYVPEAQDIPSGASRTIRPSAGQSISTGATTTASYSNICKYLDYKFPGSKCVLTRKTCSFACESPLGAEPRKTHFNLGDFRPQVSSNTAPAWARASK